jgi:hypothetical protein
MERSQVEPSLAPAMGALDAASITIGDFERRLVAPPGGEGP